MFTMGKNRWILVWRMKFRICMVPSLINAQLLWQESHPQTTVDHISHWNDTWVREEIDSKCVLTISFLPFLAMHWSECITLWIQSIRRWLLLNHSQAYNLFIDQWCYQASILDWSLWTGDRLNIHFNVALVWGLNIQTNRHWEFLSVAQIAYWHALMSDCTSYTV